MTLPAKFPRLYPDQKIVDKFWLFVDRQDCIHCCWLWTGKRWNGYGKFKYSGISIGAHRFAALITYGPSSLVAMHKYDIKLCVNPHHIRWVTHEENMLDMVAKGRGQHYGLTKWQARARLRKLREGNS